MVTHGSNPRTKELEAGEVQGQPGLPETLPPKTNKNKNNKNEKKLGGGGTCL